jgi:hypothetical protein
LATYATCAETVQYKTPWMAQRAERIYLAWARQHVVDDLAGRRAQLVEHLEAASFQMMLEVREKRSPGAALALAAINKRLAALQGLDMPVRTELTGADGGPIQLQALADLVRTIPDFDKRVEHAKLILLESPNGKPAEGGI